VRNTELAQVLGVHEVLGTVVGVVLPLLAGGLEGLGNPSLLGAGCVEVAGGEATGECAVEASAPTLVGDDLVLDGLGAA